MLESRTRGRTIGSVRVGGLRAFELPEMRTARLIGAPFPLMHPVDPDECGFAYRIG